MPQNLDLKPVNLPMELKFGQEPRTEFFNNLAHLKVELIDSPTRSQALNVAWQYVKATWADQNAGRSGSPGRRDGRRHVQIRPRGFPASERHRGVRYFQLHGHDPSQGSGPVLLPDRLRDEATLLLVRGALRQV